YGAGSHPDVEAVLSAALATIESANASIVDNIELDMTGVSDAEYSVLLYEFKADLAAYLERTAAPYRTLDELIAFNDANADTVMPHFGQEVFLAANATGGLDEPAYAEALANSRGVARRVLDEAFDAHGVDTLIAITNGPAWMTDHVNGDSFGIGSSSFAAISGYPSVTVPAGFVAGLPVGVTFIGRPWTEERLIGIAYAFEQASRARRAPELPADAEKSR
ncbi:MAG: amidase family protein, partial [Woeseiaceae bacterium]|nr:amidase family protein [Woeseiaceae bacterium]